MSVVGIDFGNLNAVVAVARNKGIDVITNEVSNRATPSLVSFGEQQRYLGEAAKTQEMFNFKNTVFGLKRLIGRPFTDPDVMNVEKKYINANLVEGERGEVAAAVQYQGEIRHFSYTQIAAMFLGNVKEFTSAEIKIPVTDAVISVPGWFTDRQRRAILDAAQVAGINILRILNDLTAAALGYGLTKLDLPDPSDAKHKPRNVVFVDLGHSSFQVSVVSFVKGKLVVKGTSYDRNLGGRDFDELLVDHFTKIFDAKYKMDIKSNAKAIFRLRAACEKVKKILSANAKTVLNVECLLDDKDVRAEVDRAEFEELIAPLVARLTGPLEKALAAAEVTADEVDFVEMIGGSTRIPAVKETLAKFFGGNLDENKLSTTLNQDEAVSRGCALQCAILSPVFKVRDFSTQEWNNYPIELAWDASVAPAPKSGEPAVTSIDAFPVGNDIPSKPKLLTFFRTLDSAELEANAGHVSLDVKAVYGPSAIDRNLPLGVGTEIGTWQLKNIRKLQAHTEAEAAGSTEPHKATIKIKAKLDANGLIV
ncbi:Hsp70 protein-domain-containing protein [Blyttiomyces helicus]|uniref:Hsp70 protein-domain-containing protein n=1 Tax=Blyttiomyces helicus TaxID=388810 RepID=A0A4P9W668_9FUNG|nr:Hsp70 protein-domain-containing protein [Blyttiomyces helicus]|eukprot:RKO86845.1 Hsp70 protein-domain-containing protein [Blyttiomyces helicus]